MPNFIYYDCFSKPLDPSVLLSSSIYLSSPSFTLTVTFVPHTTTTRLPVYFASVTSLTGNILNSRWPNLYWTFYWPPLSHLSIPLFLHFPISKYRDNFSLHFWSLHPVHWEFTSTLSPQFCSQHFLCLLVYTCHSSLSHSYFFPKEQQISD